MKRDDQGRPPAEPGGLLLHNTGVSSASGECLAPSEAEPPAARRTSTGVLLVAVDGNPDATPDSPLEHSERVYRYGVRHRARRRLLEHPSANPFRWHPSRVSLSPFASLIRAQDAEWRHQHGEKLDPGRLNALKGMGRIPRSDGSYRLSPKYQVGD